MAAHSDLADHLAAAAADVTRPAGNDPVPKSLPRQRQSVALTVAYGPAVAVSPSSLDHSETNDHYDSNHHHHYHPDHREATESSSSSSGDGGGSIHYAQWAGTVVEQAWNQLFSTNNNNHHNNNNNNSSSSFSSFSYNDDDSYYRLHSRTQSSLARMRHASLQQEPDCSAVADVLVLTYEMDQVRATDLAQCGPATTESSSSSSLLVLLLQRLQANIDRATTTYDSTKNQHDTPHHHPPPPSLPRLDIAVWDLVVLTHRPLHAERSCTQYVYHYLLPIAWLPEASSTLLPWMRQMGPVLAQSHARLTPSLSLPHEDHGRRSHPDILTRFKQALKSCESPRVEESRNRTIPHTGVYQNDNDDNEDNDNDDDGPKTLLSQSPRRPKTANSSSSQPPSSLNHHRAANNNNNNHNQKKKKKTIPSHSSPRRPATTGRFGALAFRQRRPVHNFCSLRGKDASPNHDCVWRCVDRARVISWQWWPSPRLPPTNASYDPDNNDHDHGGSNDNENDDHREAVAIVEFRGDAFLPQQIPRMMATVLAMTHGWLVPPTNDNATMKMDHTEKDWAKMIMDQLTRADLLVETPVAPHGRLYLADTRFHFDEMYAESTQLGVKKKNLDKASRREAITSWVQHGLFNNSCQDQVKQRENEWITKTLPEQAAALMRALEKHNNHRPRMAADQNTLLKLNLLPAPPEYQVVLDLLRQIVANNQWPETSLARSSVIQNDGMHREGEGRRGSFTIVHPNFANQGTTGNVPLGNQIFPELTKAIFQLETVLALKTRNCIRFNETVSNPAFSRPASSHCAVNCNAQFTPHVDSGRGAGQSLSMIVGLGDYEQGELLVEGAAYDIRYQPLEFDGWRLRHWTNPFQGERFSLVWFTPASQNSGEAKYNTGE